jgi:hypothetical protein
MADISVKIGKPNAEEQPEEKSGTPMFKFSLKARRTLDGSILISDHPEVDIIIMPEKMRIITFSKENFDDTIYQTQNRLMKYLFKKGVVVFDSIAGGNVYGSLEAKIQKPSQEYPIDDLMLMIVGKWIEEEKPSYTYQKSLEDNYTDNMTEPGEEDSTELGDVKAASEKGSVPIHQVRRYAYGL